MRLGTRSQKQSRADGIDFVRCRICGAYRRIIAGKHLSIHGIDRQAYMEGHGLSPDELVSQYFRLNRSFRRDYHAYSRREWIQVLRAIYKQHGKVSTRYLQKNHSCIYVQALWIFGNWDNALKAAGFKPKNVRLRRDWTRSLVLREIRQMRSKGLPLHASYAMRNHRSSFGAALRQYGSWNNALRAAGIAPPTHRGRLSTVRALRDALQEHPREAVPKALQQEAAPHFGSLSKAIAALKKERKVSDGWSKTKIIAMLQHMHRAKKPLGYGATRRDNVALISAAEAYFGSWRKALQGLA